MASLPKDEDIREGLRRLTMGKGNYDDPYEHEESERNKFQYGKVATDVTGSLGIWGITQQ